MIDKALEKDPARRFGSLAEFGDAMSSAMRQRGSSIRDMAPARKEQLSADELAHQGFGLLHLRRDAEAIEYFDRALRMKPNHVKALGWKSYCLGNLDRHEEAIKAAENAVALAPGFGHAWGNLGFSYSATGRHDKAIEAYRKAVALEPSAPNYNNMCNTFKIAGRWNEAMDTARRGLEYDPNHDRLWHTLGGVYIAANRPVDAIDAIKKALRIFDASNLLAESESAAAAEALARAVQTHARSVESAEAQARVGGVEVTFQVVSGRRQVISAASTAHWSMVWRFEVMEGWRSVRATWLSRVPRVPRCGLLCQRIGYGWCRGFCLSLGRVCFDGKSGVAAGLTRRSWGSCVP